MPYPRNSFDEISFHELSFYETCVLPLIPTEIKDQKRYLSLISGHRPLDFYSLLLSRVVSRCPDRSSPTQCNRSDHNGIYFASSLHQISFLPIMPIIHFQKDRVVTYILPAMLAEVAYLTWDRFGYDSLSRYLADLDTRPKIQQR
jgi:hypothetical protein